MGGNSVRRENETHLTPKEKHKRGKTGDQRNWELEEMEKEEPMKKENANRPQKKELPKSSYKCQQKKTNIKQRKKDPTPNPEGRKLT